MTDIKLYETGNGGSVQILGKDLAIYQGWENMIYIALFGGNMESTPAKRQLNEQALDFWGNTFLKNIPELQYNSRTERTLAEVSINSQGRILIREAANADLEFMRQFADISVEVELTDIDKVRIAVTIKEPDNNQAKDFIYLWDGTKADFEGLVINQPTTSNSVAIASASPVTIKINGITLTTVQSGDTLNIELINTDNDPVGTIIDEDTVQVPSQAVETEITDRFGNVLPTIIVTSASPDIDWRSYDFSDKFLSQLASPSQTIQDAIANAVDSLIQAGVWETYHAVFPFVNGTSADHSFNLKYPFANETGIKLWFIGSPTHDANGVTFASINQYLSVSANASFLQMYNDGHFSFYFRSYTPTNNNVEVSFSGDSDEGRWFLNQPNAGSGTNGMSMCSPISQVNPSPALTLTGLWMLNRPSTSILRQIRNGSLDRQITNNSGSQAPFFDSTGVSWSNIRACSGVKNAALFTIGKGMTSQQEADHYTIWQQFQTDLSRNV